ncbi:MAG: hypothetical protein NTX16_11325 [Actinobacteria bacterium]|nr:hypothetical protein [Actinomycetota bacterium]
MGLTWALPGKIARPASDAHPNTDSSDFEYVGLQRTDSAPPNVGVHPDEAGQARSSRGGVA